MQAGASVPGTTGRNVIRFTGEALAMCAVMCVGGGLLNAAFFVGLGQSGLATSSPALTVVVVVAGFAVPMTAYMWARHHSWEHSLSMSVGTAAVGVIAYVLIALGVVVANTWDVVFGAICGPACAVMLVQMFRAYDMYAGPSGDSGRRAVA
jgi:hypothetical protein